MLIMLSLSSYIQPTGLVLSFLGLMIMPFRISLGIPLVGVGKVDEQASSLPLVLSLLQLTTSSSSLLTSSTRGVGGQFWDLPRHLFLLQGSNYVSSLNNSPAIGCGRGVVRCVEGVLVLA